MAVISTLEGLQHSLSLTCNKRYENSTRKGEYNQFSALFQMVQANTALTLLGKVAQSTGRFSLPWAGRTIIYVTPILLLPLHNRTKIVQPLIEFLENHYGTLCQIAGAVSSVALFFFLNQPLFAASSLLVLGVGALERQRWLPLPAREFFQIASPILLTATNVVFGGVWGKLFAGATLLSWCANRYLASQNTAPKNFATKGNLSLKQAREWLTDHSSTNINKAFIHFPIPSSSPETELDDLLKTPSLQTLIDDVKSKKIFPDDPHSYNLLVDYLKQIASHLQNPKIDRITKEDIVQRLTREARDTCDAGKLEVVESIYSGIRIDQEGLVLTNKVFYLLQNERRRFAEGVYAEMLQNLSSALKKNPLLSQFTGDLKSDLLDITPFKTFLSGISRDLGLPAGSSESNEWAVIYPEIRLLASTGVSRYFWNRQQKDLIDFFVDVIGTPVLGKPEFYQFWHNWIQSLSISEEEKATLKNELSEGSLFGHKIEVEAEAPQSTENPPLEIDRQWIALMLVEMGILQIT